MLACFCFVLQPGLLPLHLVLHDHAPPVSSSAHAVHQHGGLAYLHCEPGEAVHTHEGEDLGGDHEPHPVEDHLTQPDLVGARRPTLELDLVALPAPDIQLVPAAGPPSAFEPTARAAPRSPPPRRSHRARAPPSAV